MIQKRQKAHCCYFGLWYRFEEFDNVKVWVGNLINSVSDLTTNLDMDTVRLIDYYDSEGNHIPLKSN